MVSLSSRSTIRESPRVVGAAVALAVLLVLVGVAIAMAGSGGNSATVSRLRHTLGVQAAALAAQRRELASIQAVATARAGAASTRARELRRARRALATSRRDARCWRAKALHPHTFKVQACLAGTG